MLRSVVEERAQNVVIMDVMSKLAQERIIFIDSYIDDELANAIIAQMIYLDSVNQEEPINIYINSYGGSVVDALAIYDVSQALKSPIRTVCVGKAASMGAILMLMGKERCGFKHSKFMVHKVSGGGYGNPEDLKVSYEESLKFQEELEEILREKTSIKVLSSIDTWLNSKEALECQLITKIL